MMHSKDSSLAYDIAIIGAGIVGAACAYELSKRYPTKRIVILERENSVAYHQSGRNSGVIHSGLYYRPGSLKATLCQTGRQALLDFCNQYSIHYELCGKIIVATNSVEDAELSRLYKNGLENGLENLALLDAAQIKQREPHIKGMRAIEVPQAGIVDFVAVTNKLIDVFLASSNGDQNSLKLGFGVVDIIETQNSVTLCAADGRQVRSSLVVKCAGLFCDRICQLLGSSLDLKILPFRGDYYALTPLAQHKIKHLVYPVPDRELPFLGVHFTRMINGGVECGPNAVLSLKRDGYSRSAFSVVDAIEALTFRGTWRLLRKYWRYSLREYHRAWSKHRFLLSLQQLMPDLQLDDIAPARAGIRAQAVRKNGELCQDFEFRESENSIHVLNAPSPAATSSLAIAQFICEKYQEKLSNTGA